MKTIYSIVCILLLVACTNTNVVELRIPTSSENRSEDYKVHITSEEHKTIVTPVPTTKETKNSPILQFIESCARYKLPVLPETPSLPIDKIHTPDLSNEEIVDILSNHIQELRKIISDIKLNVNKTYQDYLKTCKK